MIDAGSIHLFDGVYNVALPEKALEAPHLLPLAVQEDEGGRWCRTDLSGAIGAPVGEWGSGSYESGRTDALAVGGKHHGIYAGIGTVKLPQADLFHRQNRGPGVELPQAKSVKGKDELKTHQPAQDCQHRPLPFGPSFRDGEKADGQSKIKAREMPCVVEIGNQAKQKV